MKKLFIISLIIMTLFMSCGSVYVRPCYRYVVTSINIDDNGHKTIKMKELYCNSTSKTDAIFTLDDDDFQYNIGDTLKYVLIK